MEKSFFLNQYSIDLIVDYAVNNKKVSVLAEENGKTEKEIMFEIRTLKKTFKLLKDLNVFSAEEICEFLYSSYKNN